MKKENKTNEKKLSTQEMILSNTKTIILLMCIMVICSIIALLLSGYAFYHSVHSTKSNEVIEEENTEYDVSMFNSIDTDKFVELFNKDEKSLIYLGRETCGYCVKFLPNLQKAQDEYDYNTYYLDITTVSNDDVEKITKLDKFLKENYGYTPMVLIVENGKILNKTVDNYNGVGYTEYETFTKFLNKVDFVK